MVVVVDVVVVVVVVVTVGGGVVTVPVVPVVVVPVVTVCAITPGAATRTSALRRPTTAQLSRERAANPRFTGQCSHACIHRFEDSGVVRDHRVDPRRRHRGELLGPIYRPGPDGGAAA